MKMPQNIGPIHFVGIGGIGMSGIAEVLLKLGYIVQGSDIAEGANVVRLREKGIKVMVGHAAENIGDAQVVVVSSAIQSDNPELKEARARLLPVVRRARNAGRADALQVGHCRWRHAWQNHNHISCGSAAGCRGHGPGRLSMAVSSMPMVPMRAMGDGDWMVVEADESDGTFVKLPADVAIGHQHRSRASGSLSHL